MDCFRGSPAVTHPSRWSGKDPESGGLMPRINLYQVSTVLEGYFPVGPAANFRMVVMTFVAFIEQKVLF